MLRFIFIPDGAEASAEALARIASPIRIPATFVPDAAGAGTRAEPRPGWSETFASQSAGAGAAPAFDDGAAAKENVAAGIDGAQRRPAAYGWPGGRSAAYTGSTSRDPGVARSRSTTVQPTLPVQAQTRRKDRQFDQPDPNTPGLFTDDKGEAVVDANKQPIMRPAALDPHFFVQQGRIDRELEDQLLGSDPNAGPIAAAVWMIERLENFRQGRPWDAQRLGGKFHDEFRSYATVAIGLYGAANGIPEPDMLFIQNLYARLFSRYKKTEPMSKDYPYLPEVNVKNTDIGYRLFKEGHIAARSNP